MGSGKELRLVKGGNWWKESLKLKQEMFAGSELVRLKNGFWKPGDPAGGEFYEKYAVKLTDGREVVFGARVSDVISTLGKGDALIDWAVNEGLSAALGEPVLVGVGVVGGVRSEIELRGGWRKLDAAARRCERYVIKMDTANARIQPWDQYSEEELIQAHRGAFDARFKKRDEAAELGTQAHKLIDYWLRYHDLQESEEVKDEESGRYSTIVHFEKVYFLGEDGQEYLIDLSKERPEVQAACAAFHHWWCSQELEMVATEQFLADLEFGVAGTVDCVVRAADGALCILDWKTSSAVYETHLLQVAAYARLWSLCKGEMPARAYIVRLDKKTAQTQVVPAFICEEDRDRQLQGWARCVELFRWKKETTNYLKGFKPEFEDE